MSPYRKPAGPPIDVKVEFRPEPPQFRDERCAACGHDKNHHFVDGNVCASCKVEKRCQRFVWKDGQKP